MVGSPYDRAMALSPIFEFADRFVTERAALDPCMAAEEGIDGFDDQLTDYSPAGNEARVDHARRSLAELTDLPATNDDDRLAKDFITERLEVALLADDTGEWLRALRAVDSPSNILRAAFDLMPRTGEQAWANIAARLQALPAALDGLRDAYQHGRATGVTAARRQALVAAEQCATWADNRWFDTLADEAEALTEVPAALQQRIRQGADATNEAYGAFARYLRHEYAPDADPVDGCGPERYRVGVRIMLGADLEPDEMYEWAWSDFHHLRREIADTCALIRAGASFAEVIDLLEHDPDRAEHGVEAYQRWLQSLTDEALDSQQGTLRDS